MTWNLLEQDAREEGIEEGIKKGLVLSVKSLMQKFGYTVTEAMDVLSIPDDEREQLRAMIK